MRKIIRKLSNVVNVVINIINECTCRDRKAKSLGLRLGPAEPKAHMPVSKTITNEQKFRVTINPVTATGRPAQLDPNSPPTWEVAAGSSVTVTPSADGRSAEIISSDTPGDSQVVVKADADLGEGVEEISDVISVTVEGARATSLGLTVSDPEPK